MKRKDVLKSPGYWITNIQIRLYNCAVEFMEKCGLNRKQLAEHLGVSKGHVTQLLSGDYNYSLNKLVETSLKMGYVPELKFIPVEEVILEDSNNYKSKTVILKSSFVFEMDDNFKEAA